MNDEKTSEVEHPYVLKMKEQRRRHLEACAQRERYVERVMGSDDRYNWQVPQPVADYDAQLGEHIAQLRNAVRYLMGDVLQDDVSIKDHAQSAGAVDRLIRTNLAIIKALKTAPPAATSKTVRCGGTGPEQQD